MARKTKGRSFFSRIDPLTSAMLVFPLFVLYEIGIVAVPSAQNGADLITAAIFRLLHHDLRAYIFFNAALLVGFLVACLYLRRTHSSDLRLFWPVLFESALYAVSMGSLICFVMVDLLHVDPSLSLTPHTVAAGGGSDVVSSVIKSLGAGVHEELLFRVLILGGTAYLCSHGLGLRRWLSLLIAFAVSSVLFSAAHHIIGGEPFRVGVFTYRILCGLIFASLYEFRGLAVAVYTHTIYDVFVFLFKGG
jgi:hypothetical protein